MRFPRCDLSHVLILNNSFSSINTTIGVKAILQFVENYFLSALRLCDTLNFLLGQVSLFTQQMCNIYLTTFTSSGFEIDYVLLSIVFDLIATPILASIEIISILHVS